MVRRAVVAMLQANGGLFTPHKQCELCRKMWTCAAYVRIYVTHSHHYFKYCKISALALLKMVMHARSGGNLEVMGLMLGKVDGETMIIMDSFALPVEGTETRVNAQAAAYEYMAAYIENAKQVRHRVPEHCRDCVQESRDEAQPAGKTALKCDG